MMNWNERYLLNNTPWDHEEAHPALVHWLSENAFSGEVLVPGCGRGIDASAIAETGVPVLGVDIAPEAIRLAQQLKSTARFQIADILALPQEWENRLSGIYEHTCYCAILPSQRPDYVRSLAGVIRPGGIFLACFYVDPTPAPGPPFPTNRAELKQLFSPYFKLKWESKRTYPEFLFREYIRL
jgi:SAM-dependent methyltransferase